MKELHKKFIIEDDNVIISKCIYHKEIVTNSENVDGGGWFYIKNNSLYLYGDSHDYGKYNFDKLKIAIKNGNIFSNTLCTRSIIDMYDNIICIENNEEIKLK